MLNFTYSQVCIHNYKHAWYQVQKGIKQCSIENLGNVGLHRICKSNVSWITLIRVFQIVQPHVHGHGKYGMNVDNDQKDHAHGPNLTKQFLTQNVATFPGVQCLPYFLKYVFYNLSLLCATCVCFCRCACLHFCKWRFILSVGKWFPKLVFTCRLLPNHEWFAHKCQYLGNRSCHSSIHCGRALQIG